MKKFLIYLVVMVVGVFLTSFSLAASTSISREGGNAWFMKVIPVGEYAGQAKYWPFFWMLPAVFVYFIVEPFILCLIFNFKNTKNTLTLTFKKAVKIFKK